MWISCTSFHYSINTFILIVGVRHLGLQLGSRRQATQNIIFCSSSLWFVYPALHLYYFSITILTFIQGYLWPWVGVKEWIPLLTSHAGTKIQTTLPQPRTLNGWCSNSPILPVYAPLIVYSAISVLCELRHFWIPPCKVILNVLSTRLHLMLKRSRYIGETKGNSDSNHCGAALPNILSVF